MKRNAMMILSCALLFVTACSAQTTTPDADSVEVSAQAAPVVGAMADVEVAGYCPVAYVEASKPVKGSAQYASVRDGKTYWFVNDGARQMFEANPDKYDVAYRGWCATALAMGGGKVTSDPSIFTAHEGRVYLFSNAKAKAAFDANLTEMAAKADANWGAVATR